MPFSSKSSPKMRINAKAAGRPATAAPAPDRYQILPLDKPSGARAVRHVGCPPEDVHGQDRVPVDGNEATWGTCRARTVTKFDSSTRLVVLELCVMSGVLRRMSTARIGSPSMGMRRHGVLVAHLSYFVHLGPSDVLDPPLPPSIRAGHLHFVISDPKNPLG